MWPLKDGGGTRGISQNSGPSHFWEGDEHRKIHVSESGTSLNGPNLFTELPFLQKSYQTPSFTEFLPRFSLKCPFFTESGESNRSLTPILLKSIAIHLPLAFLSRYFGKSMPSSWQTVPYTPPICIAIRLPFVSRYFFRSIRVRGRWDTPNWKVLLRIPFPRIDSYWYASHGGLVGMCFVSPQSCFRMMHSPSLRREAIPTSSAAQCPFLSLSACLVDLATKPELSSSILGEMPTRKGKVHVLILAFLENPIGPLDPESQKTPKSDRNKWSKFQNVQRYISKVNCSTPKRKP